MLIAGIVIAGWIALYLMVPIILARDNARLRGEFQQQINALTVRFEAAGLSAAQGVAPAGETLQESGNAIAAVAAALAAKKVHVRAVQPQQTHPLGDPWAQQGRANVQSSHDIAQRGH